jgi:hypothetical protein
MIWVGHVRVKGEGMGVKLYLKTRKEEKHRRKRRGQLNVF